MDTIGKQKNQGPTKKRWSDDLRNEARATWAREPTDRSRKINWGSLRPQGHNLNIILCICYRQILKEIKAKKDAALTEVVEDFLDKEFGVKTEIEMADKIQAKDGNKIIVAKVNTTENKNYIMSNKNTLNSQKIYIDNDLTAEESKIKKHLRNKSKQERKDEKTARVAYQKLYVDDKILIWNKDDEELQEAKETTAGKTQNRHTQEKRIKEINGMVERTDKRISEKEKEAMAKLPCKKEPCRLQSIRNTKLNDIQ